MVYIRHPHIPLVRGGRVDFWTWLWGGQRHPAQSTLLCQTKFFTGIKYVYPYHPCTHHCLLGCTHFKALILQTLHSFLISLIALIYRLLSRVKHSSIGCILFALTFRLCGLIGQFSSLWLMKSKKCPGRENFMEILLYLSPQCSLKGLPVRFHYLIATTGKLATNR